MEQYNQNYREQEDTIDLLEIAFFLLHYIWIILAGAILAAGIAFLYKSITYEPQYVSSTSVYILGKSDEKTTLTYSDTQLASTLTKDYEKLITSRFVLESAIHELELGEVYNYKTFAKKISIKNPDSTRIIEISVIDNDPLMAQKMANCIRSIAAEHITNVMSIGAVNVVDEANVPLHAESSGIKKTTLLGFMAGFVAVAAVFVCIYLLDDTIKCQEDVEKYLQLSVLSSIPAVEDETRTKHKGKRSKAKGNQEE